MPFEPTIVYTDGACRGNPGPGGWAWAVPGGRYRSGAAAHTTNQRMEVQAVLDAVGAFDGSLEVVSDSTYVVNCFRDRWWEGWIRRGWTNSQKKPVANRDLWEPLVAAYLVDTSRIRFRWVKGHSTDVMNDLVDRLAVEAAAQQAGREGDEPPDALGAPDRPGPKAAQDRPGPKAAQDRPGPKAAQDRPGPSVTQAGGAHPEEAAPTGHLLVVTGLRPLDLGGYDDNPIAADVTAQLAEILAAKQRLHPDLIVLTGLGLGTEMLAATAVSGTGVPYVAVLPFPNQEQPWSASNRQRFAHLLEGATGRVILQHRAPTSKALAGTALARRDAWLARHAAEALVVWDGRDTVVGRTLRSLQDHLGEEQVWVLEV